MTFYEKKNCQSAIQYFCIEYHFTISLHTFVCTHSFLMKGLSTVTLAKR